jgi:hypothetical protein
LKNIWPQFEMDVNSMTRREMLGRLQEAPGMFGLDGTYDMYVAYLQGYDHAEAGEWLHDFTAWLQGELGYGGNLGWQSLVLRIAYPEASERWRTFGPREHDVDARLAVTLFELLGEFDKARAARGAGNP